jgi:hypothetical protein
MTLTIQSWSSGKDSSSLKSGITTDICIVFVFYRSLDLFTFNRLQNSQNCTEFFDKLMLRFKDYNPANLKPLDLQIF